MDALQVQGLEVKIMIVHITFFLALPSTFASLCLLTLI